jgi:acyl-CoA synthetase (AMP-forming)/AMP-acid ligase II
LVPAGAGIDWADHGGGDEDGRGDIASAVTPDSPAYVLCTSGSTALPKGIPLSHRNALARYNPRSPLISGASSLTRVLSFGPLSHGSGSALVVGMLSPSIEYHLLPAERFARDPGELLRLAGPTGATLMGGASSAIRAALRAVQRRPRDVDLSAIERFLFSTEMTAPEVIDQLLDVGGRFGLRPEAVGVNYGLGEGGATTTPLGGGVRIDDVDLDALVAEGRAVPPRPGGQVKRVVSCGRPVRRVELRIVGPGGPLADRHVGEVQFRGPVVMDGYVSSEGEDPFDDGWLRTGDLGYLADGELFVTGRSKEVIVHRGRKYHPEDLEWAAGQVPGVMAGRCVAFAPVGGNEGEVVVAVEVGEDAVSGVEALVRAAVTNAVGLVPRHVLVLGEGALPTAPAGKMQRLAARDAYDRGELA